MCHKKSCLTIAGLSLFFLLSCFPDSSLRAAGTPTPTPTPTATPTATPVTVGPNFTATITDTQTVDGYRLKYGATSGSYTTTVDLGPAKTKSFSNFPIGTIYMVATAYNAAGESAPTAEIKITVMSVPQAPGSLDISNNQGLAEISTRSQVAPGDNVMIGGFIAPSDQKVAVRALGPSLGQWLPDPLSKTTLELHDGTGATIETNDGWKNGPDAAELTALKLAPPNDKESALIADVKAGAYTAIVRGNGAETGVGLVEVYALP